MAHAPGAGGGPVNRADALAQRRARVAALHAAGLSGRRIAAELGVPGTTVRRDLAVLTAGDAAHGAPDQDTGAPDGAPPEETPRSSTPPAPAPDPGGAPPGAHLPAAELVRRARALDAEALAADPDRHRPLLLAALAHITRGLTATGPGTSMDRRYLTTLTQHLAALTQHPDTGGDPP